MADRKAVAWCEHCDQPMSPAGRAPVSLLSAMERREYRHNGRVAVVPISVRHPDGAICEDCDRMLEETDHG